MTGTINVEEPSMKHNFKKIEPKWQKKWEEQQAFKAVDGSDKPKFYGLVEFPYPSGAGMHVGHIIDIVKLLFNFTLTPASTPK